MFVVIAAWAALGFAALSAIHETAASTSTSAELAEREWTSASGGKRARAILVRVEGERLTLRRSNGKLATITLPEISDADRQYVATSGARLVSITHVPAIPPAPAPPIVKKAIEKVQSLRQASGWLDPSQVVDKARRVPGAVLYVRVSRQFLEDYVERAVHQQKPVNDYILGTQIEGASTTRGKTRLVLLPSFGRLLGKISFEGTVDSQTRGYHGPVVLHQVSSSAFRANKLLSMDESGFRVAPAVVSAPTSLETIGISTCLPRLRGRIATRIAWRRVAGSHAEAESITAEHTAATIARDFDKRINTSIAKVDAVFQEKVPEFAYDRDPKEMRFRSSPECVEITLVRKGATAEEHQLRPPAVVGNPDVAVRVHRALLSRTIADPELRKNLGPMFGKLLKARYAQEKKAVLNLGQDPPGGTKWSLDLEWLSMDYADVN